MASAYKKKDQHHTLKILQSMIIVETLLWTNTIAYFCAELATNKKARMFVYGKF
jgi:hypothetical protein